MSRKIYNKVVLEWNKTSQQYETVYEDSYQYNGPIAQADDFDDFGEDIKKAWPEVAKDLKKELDKATKKAAKTGASEFNKQFVSIGAGLSKMLTETVGKAGSSIGKNLGAQIGNAISSAVSLGSSEGLRSLEKDILDLEKRAPDLGKKLIGSLSGDVTFDPEMGDKAEDIWALLWENAGDDIQQQNAVIGDLSQALGISAQQAEILLQQFRNGVDLATMFSDEVDKAPSKLQKMTKGLGNMAKGIELEGAEKEFADSIEAGITSGLDFIPSNAFTKALGVDAGLESAAKAFGQKFKKQGAAVGQFMTKHWKAALGAGLAIGLTAVIMTSLAEATDEIGESFGAIGVTEMRSDLIDAKADALALGYEFSDVADVITTLSSEFGVSVSAAREMTGGVLDTAKALGLSVDNATQLVGTLMAVTDMSAKETEDFMKMAEVIAFSAGIAPGIVTADMAESAEEIASFSKDTGENMVRAATKAAQLGMSLADVAEIAEGLLDFETSVSAEMEASMMIGRQLNFQRARQLALTGDLSGMMDEVLGQLGGEAEFNRMNVLQRKSVADALGISVAQMAKLASRAGKTTEELMRMGDVTEDMMDKMVGKESLSKITWLGNKFKVWGTKLLAKIAGWFDQNKSLVFEMVEGAKKFAGWLGTAANFLAQNWKWAVLFAGAWASIKMGLWVASLTKGTGIIGTLFKHMKGIETVTPKPGSGTGLGSLSEGLKKMGTGKVLAGALNLIPTAIGMVAIIPGIPAIIFFGKANLKKLYFNLSALGRGLTQLGTAKVTAGAANLALIGIGGAVAIAAIPFLSFMMIPTLANLTITMGALGIGLTALGTGTVSAGAGNLALIGLAAGLAILSIPFLSFIALTGAFVGTGLGLLAAGLIALGGAGVVGLIGVGLIAALGVAMIPFAFALSLVTPLVEAFGVVLVNVVGALAGGISQVIFSIAGAFEKLALLGPDLLTTAVGIGAISLALMSFGGGSLIAGIGSAIGSFFGGDPVEKFQAFADLGPGLNQVATSIAGMEPSIAIVSGMTIALSGLADSLAQVSSQGFLALPILGTLATLGAINTLVAGFAPPSEESEVHDKAVDGKIKTLTGEIIGLRSDMSNYFADDKLSIAMSRKIGSKLTGQFN